MSVWLGEETKRDRREEKATFKKQIFLGQQKSFLFFDGTMDTNFHINKMANNKVDSTIFVPRYLESKIHVLLRIYRER